MRKMEFTFNKNWFEKHQEGLLWLLNTPIVKHWFRRVMRIRKEDCPINVKIEKIFPDKFIFDKKLILTDFIVFKNGKREIYTPCKLKHRQWKSRCKIEKHLAYQYKVDLRTHAKFGKRLCFAFRYLWTVFHIWDNLIANKFAAQLNLGFDTYTMYPDADEETTTVDGQVWIADANLPFSTLRSTAGNQSRDSSTIEGLYIATSSTTNQYALLTRVITLFDISGLEAGATITAATYSIWFYQGENDLSGDTSDNSKFVVDDCSPASNTALQPSDFNIANWGGNDYGRSTNNQSAMTNQYEDAIINASGLTFIDNAYSGDGIVKFGIRYGWDFDNTTTGLTWNSNLYQGISFNMADYTGTRTGRCKKC